MITLLMVWLSGIIPGYLFLRSYQKGVSGKWTVGDRTFTILTSFIFSWISVLTAGVLYFLDGLDYDKECKW